MKIGFHSILIIILVALNLLGVLLNLVFGSVSIPFGELFEEQWAMIIWESRWPSAITALLCGMALSAAGLLLQSYFRNPLAGPSLLGITSGANLMIALLTVGGIQLVGLSFSLQSAPLLLMFAAFTGAMLTLLLLLTIGRIVRSQIMLLISGMLISYLVSAVITLIGYYANSQGVQQLMIWGMGDFSSLGNSNLSYYSILVFVGLAASFTLVKPLNAWMLGEQYAVNLGIKVKSIKFSVLLTTGWLAAVTTAGCGPISFVGLAMPHIARMLTNSDDHRLLLPVSILLGGLCCELCLWISTLPNGGTLLPINALTPLFGVPVILYVMLKK